MPSSYQLSSVTYDPFDVVIGGPIFVYQSAYYISGISVMTEGFIYDLADIWAPSETCATVTWTEVT